MELKLFWGKTTMMMMSCVRAGLNLRTRQLLSSSSAAHWQQARLLSVPAASSQGSGLWRCCCARQCRGCATCADRQSGFQHKKGSQALHAAGQAAQLASRRLLSSGGPAIQPERKAGVRPFIRDVVDNGKLKAVGVTKGLLGISLLQDPAGFQEFEQVRKQ